MYRETEVQRHEIGVYNEKVGKVFLYRAHDLVVICFGESLEGRLLYDIAEIYASSETFFQLPVSRVSHICGILRTWDPATPR
jgi:hypothetical protein